jgi:2-oxoglutarate dehydrogenase E2 component (dihydrolipoamide succinyltransferase)
MAKVEVVMPKMGESVMEGTVLTWHKQPGDPVEEDEALLEIGTDKVDSEIPSPAAGTLAEIVVAEGETVEVGTVLAVIQTASDAERESPKPAASDAEPESPKPASDAETEQKTSRRKEEHPPQKSDVVDQKPEPSAAPVTSAAVEVIMPKMGESVMEGTVLVWHKKPGDKIEADEALLEIGTDKVDSEIPSRARRWPLALDSQPSPPKDLLHPTERRRPARLLNPPAQNPNRPPLLNRRLRLMGAMGCPKLISRAAAETVDSTRHS